MRILFHLVSGQNSQVYIMSRFYKPAVNVLFYTETTRKNLPALREVLKGATIKEVLIHPFKYPKIRKVLRLAVLENKATAAEMIFNITGGTKIQSIAMYEAARENNAISAYLNSEAHNIIELGDEEPVQHMVSDIDIAPAEYLLANGQKTKQSIPFISEHSGQLIAVFSEHFKEFSRFALDFAASHHNINSLPVSRVWEKGRSKGTKYEFKKGAFHLKLVLDGEVLFEATESPAHPLMEDLAGMWIEKASYDIIKESKTFSNPALNTKIVYADQRDKNEFDILAMYGTDLCVFECKSGAIKAADIDQLVALKKMLGSYTRLFIISFFSPTLAMRERMTESNITWLSFQSLKSELEKISSYNANV